MDDVVKVPLPVPANRAVILWTPVDNVEIDNVAWPPARATVPKLVELSRNVTLPPAVEPGPTTEAVNVTGCPVWEGVVEEVTVTVVAAVVVVVADEVVPTVVVVVPAVAVVLVVEGVVLVVGNHSGPRG